MFRALATAFAAITRYMIAAPFFLGVVSWQAIVAAHSALWPRQAAADEPSDFAADYLDADDELFGRPAFERLPDHEMTDFPLGQLCREFAWDRTGTLIDEEPVDVSSLPLHVQAWLFSLDERQLDHLGNELAPSIIERHVNAKSHLDRLPGLPAVVLPDAAHRLVRRAALAPKPQPPRAAAMEAPDDVLAYAPAPRL